MSTSRKFDFKTTVEQHAVPLGPEKFRTLIAEIAAIVYKHHCQSDPDSKGDISYTEPQCSDRHDAKAATQPLREVSGL